MTAQEALEAFRVKHNLNIQSYQERRLPVSVGRLTLGFPNPGKLHIHDLHHALLDIPPNFWGEVEISAFELRGGVPSALILLLCVGSLLLGFLVRPRWVLGTWRRYQGCRNLYQEEKRYQELLTKPKEELRLWMRLPALEGPKSSQNR